MVSPDPIVSPTLAQLYIAQGHVARARETIDQILAADPELGEALVLRDRLDANAQARLELEIDREVVLRWSVPTRIWEALEGRPSLVLCAQAAEGDRAPYYLSGPAEVAEGELHLPFAFRTGSASACLALLHGKRRELRVLAVAESASW
jgi:hypothetical protein